MVKHLAKKMNLDLFEGILEEKSSQAATEYLLILAAILTVLATVVQYVMQTPQESGDVVEEKLENIENMLRNR